MARLHRAFRRLAHAAFERGLGKWFAEQGQGLGPGLGLQPDEALAIAGKTWRGLHGEEIPGVHLVATFAHQTRVVLAEAETLGKGPELAGIQAVLAALPTRLLSARVVTGDALLASRALCRPIVRTGDGSETHSGGRRTDLLAVGNPLPLPFGMKGPTTYVGSLPYVAAEADALGKIARAFPYATAHMRTFIGREAKRAEVLDALACAWYAHLALHGQFYPTNPRHSHIVLSGDARTLEAERVLTLGECLDGTVSPHGLRLLVLSACETSLTDVRRAADEVVGLAASFL